MYRTYYKKVQRYCSGGRHFFTYHTRRMGITGGQWCRKNNPDAHDCRDYETFLRKVLYDGIPINQLKEKYRDVFGYLPQEFGFYPEFTVKDYLEYVSVLKGLDAKESKCRIHELMERLTLSAVRNKKIAKLSGGMKRRVGIAQALLNDPEILILDEPTSGLDPGERVHFRNLLSEFAHDRIVLISTHIVPDVEYIANQNAVMKEGRLIAKGTTEELVKIIDKKVWTARIPMACLPEYERKLQIVNLRNEEKNQIAIRYLAEEPCTDNSQPATPHLEDLYLLDVSPGNSRQEVISMRLLRLEMKRIIKQNQRCCCCLWHYCFLFLWHGCLLHFVTAVIRMIRKIQFSCMD